MDPTAIIELIAQAIKLINTVIADQPPPVKIGQALVGWNAFKALVLPFLPADQKAILLSAEQQWMGVLAKEQSGGK